MYNFTRMLVYIENYQKLLKKTDTQFENIEIYFLTIGYNFKHFK